MNNSGWISVEDKLPDFECLAFYTNERGKGRIIVAHYIEKHKEVADTEDTEWLDYDETTDEYYYPAGWYENIDNWPDYSFIKVNEGIITHWRPLPSMPPKTEVIN